MEKYAALLAQLDGRAQLIVRTAVTLGLRLGELFALRRKDVEPGRLRIDESLAFRADGTKETKTEASDSYVHLPAGIEAELRNLMGDLDPESLLFTTANGTPMSPNNFERDVIAPAAITGGHHEGPSEESPQG
jgi:integrase